MTDLTALGCYIFAGGFTLGVRKHFNVLAHFEEGPYGTATAAQNIPELRGNIFMDPATWPVADYAGRVDFVYGNPPCAPWSVCSAGRAIPWRLDPRVGCTQRLYGLLDSISPKVWVTESVRPTFTKGRELIDEMVLKGIDRGYDATVLFVEGSRHGLPQRRPRLFLVLSRYALDFPPTGIKKLATVGDAFKRPFATTTAMQIESQFHLDLAKRSPVGVRVAKIFNDLYPERITEAERAGTKVRGRPSFQTIRLDPAKPSCTLTGGYKQIHPTEDRYISIEESAALCGYPRSFQFVGQLGKRYAQLAQAVMPPVGEYLARHVAAGIRAGRPVGRPAFRFTEVFTDRVETRPLEAQRALALDAPKTISLPPKTRGSDAMTKPDALSIEISKYAHITVPAVVVEAAVAKAGGSIAWAETAAVATPAAEKPTRRRAAAAPVPVPPAPTTSRPAAGAAKRGNAAPAPVSTADATPKRGSGARIRELLAKGWATDKILETIHAEFPGSKAGPSDVNWNKRKMMQGAAPAATTEIPPPAKRRGKATAAMTPAKF